ncbi:Tannase/feruloyl esterase [Dendryphion nanum]|uniref:Carboxylic ester hydrolase n=1 Tax=Dendryphion nanum TaxID=256645 RepID=A0A9P9E195_9PLEO|nr:Tannase/feruloyl esterase [Dendryphion nanum]
MANSSLLLNCEPSAIPLPTVFGAEFLSVKASLTRNYTAIAPAVANPNHWDISGENISFCNVTITHTHPGQNDLLTTQIWLPISPPWNKRLKTVGGGGWIAGLGVEVVPQTNGAIAEGYAVVTTNAGVPDVLGDWALTSQGNVNLNALQNFAHVGLKDATLAAKSVVNSFFGQPPKFSYFSGCSQGGRQGYAFAQRYPDIFDGIAAAAPGLNYPNFFTSALYPQQVMHELKYYPHPCELDAIRDAAIKSCDGKDGLVDGIISHPNSCKFDPFSLVDKPLNCSTSTTPGGPKSISKAGAAVADAAWNGSKGAKGEFLWYSPGIQAPLTGPATIVGTTCTPDGKCDALPLPVFTEWVKYFLLKDKNANYGSNYTRREFERLYDQAVREYRSIIGTDWPDLKDFREAGGKLITYHGTADSVIPYQGTRHYFDAVKALDRNVHDFYRLFEAPGLGHCGFDIGGYPGGTFNALVRWVEEGVAPELLEARSAVTNKTSILCPYPKIAQFKGKQGSEYGAKDFVCR